MSLSLVQSRALLGLEAASVTVEVHLANGLPSFTLVGLADVEVKEARERVRSAIQNAGLEFPNSKRITVNLAPADLPKGFGPLRPADRAAHPGRERPDRRAAAGRPRVRRRTFTVGSVEARAWCTRHGAGLAQPRNRHPAGAAGRQRAGGRAGAGRGGLWRRPPARRGAEVFVERCMHRPTCSPHHTSSAVALVGGGSPPRPGEISLAHHGVLFLNARSAFAALREPLETGTITIARRAAGRVSGPLPARRRAEPPAPAATSAPGSRPAAARRTRWPAIRAS